MKAYLIDATSRTVTEVEHTGDYRQIYTYIGADTFDCVRIGRDGDGIFIDDEGLFTINDERPRVPGFRCAFYPSQPLIGNGLVLGCDAEGESTAPRISLADLTASIRWCYVGSGEIPPMQILTGEDALAALFGRKE